MVAQALAFISALALAAAGPIPAAPKRFTVRDTTVFEFHNGTTALPTFQGKLQKVGLAHGVQNYTCSGPGATATDNTALAVLYDITDFVPGVGSTPLPEQEFLQLPSILVNDVPEPLSLTGTLGVDLAATSNPFPPPGSLTVESSSGKRTFPFLGYHFFDKKVHPNFDLRQGTSDGLVFVGAKNATINQPKEGNIDLDGPAKTGPVVWVQLTKGDGESIGITETYRVFTAGGNPLPCTEEGTMTIPYAASYFFLQ